MQYKVLRVDLSNRSYKIEEVPNDVIENYIGGKGLAAYYLCKELEPKIDPLSQANKLMFFIGPSFPQGS